MLLHPPLGRFIRLREGHRIAMCCSEARQRLANRAEYLRSRIMDVAMGTGHCVFLGRAPIWYVIFLHANRSFQDPHRLCMQWWRPRHVSLVCVCPRIICEGLSTNVSAVSTCVILQQRAMYNLYLTTAVCTFHVPSFTFFTLRRDGVSTSFRCPLQLE